MPIYVYKCECGEEYEELQSNLSEGMHCPNCGGWAKRIATTPNFTFFSEERKKIYKQQTGVEINDKIDEKKYLQKYGGQFVSKKEWEAIKESQMNKYNINIDKNKVKVKMIEEMKRIIENEDERRKIIKMSKESEGVTKKLLNDNLGNVKITKE